MKWKDIKKYSSHLEELKRMSPHELLGLSENATPSQIKSAYRKKVKTYHPDKTDPFMREFSQEYTKLIIQAYEILMEQRQNG